MDCFAQTPTAKKPSIPDHARQITVSCSKLHVLRMSLAACLLRQHRAKFIQAQGIHGYNILKVPGDVSFDMCLNCKEGKEHQKMLSPQTSNVIKLDFRKKRRTAAMKPQKAAIAIMLLFAVMLTGCAATQVAIEKKDLNVSSSMSHPIFVTPGLGKNILVQVRNMSTLKVESQTLQANVENSLRAKGYNVVTDPSAADYILQAQLMDAKANILSARQLAGGQQGAGSAAGAVAGGLLASGTNSWRSVGVAAGIGALAGGIAETIADAAVKSVTYELSFAVKVTEVPTQKASETQMVITAEKVNLKPEEALPILVQKTCEALANVI